MEHRPGMSLCISYWTLGIFQSANVSLPEGSLFKGTITYPTKQAKKGNSSSQPPWGSRDIPVTTYEDSVKYLPFCCRPWEICGSHFQKSEAKWWQWNSWKSQSGWWPFRVLWFTATLYWLVVGGHTREMLKSYYSQMLNVWYTYLHLPLKLTKCRSIGCTLSIWDTVILTTGDEDPEIARKESPIFWKVVLRLHSEFVAHDG